eukprot:6178593-Pleurochrysis_carterae.AAC.1
MWTLVGIPARLMSRCVALVPAGCLTSQTIAVAINTISCNDVGRTWRNSTNPMDMETPVDDGVAVQLERVHRCLDLSDDRRSQGVTVRGFFARGRVNSGVVSDPEPEKELPGEMQVGRKTEVEPPTLVCIIEPIGDLRFDLEKREKLTSE